MTPVPTPPTRPAPADPSAARTVSPPTAPSPLRVTGLPAGTLLALARHGLLEAADAATAAERYAAAHLAALRAAAAVLACRARPAGSARRSRPTSAWVLLAGVAPELAEWAQFFAAGAAKRAAAEAGLAGAVSAREADDLLRDAEQFLLLVEAALDLPGHRPTSQHLLTG